MATNPLIALQVRSPDIAGNYQRGRLQALQEQQADQQSQRQNRLLDLQEQQFAGQQQSAGLQRQAAQLQISAEQRKLQGQAAGELGYSLGPMITAGDFGGAQQLLDSTFQQLTQQGVPIQEPAALREALRTGNGEQALAMTNAMLSRAEKFGYVPREPQPAAAPAGVQTAEWYANATPEQRQAFEATQRSGAAGGSPYIAPVQTSQGLLSWDHRTGQFQPALDPQGRPYMPPAIDPAAQAAVTGAKETAKLDAQRIAEIGERARDEKEVGRLLDLASPLLDVTTSSGIGAGVDAAGRLVGVSSEGAAAAAELKAIQGLLVSKMPRMEGPQSDKDVMLYREMAGQIGDPTIPAAQKKAAMEMVRAINSRYTGQQQPAGAPAATPSQRPPAPAVSSVQPTRLRFNPATGELE